MNCKICLLDIDNEPSISPCNCSGTMKYIHQNCFNLWLEYRKNNNLNFRICEICNSNYNLPEHFIDTYPIDAPPVFFGHYWLEDDYPKIQSHNAVCLDYSVAKGGSLVAYRWSGESVLNENNFVFIQAG